SVFWIPLSQAIGIDHAAPGDWKRSTLGWMFTLFFVFLGSSAALFGRWLERVGPRRAGVVAACCWGGGFMISALGVVLHWIALLWIGSGVIGGCGLGLGYISPVSTLIKWFPDRRTPPTPLPRAGVTGAMITTRNVHVDQAWRTPQFWLLWGVLCLNVSAGIGVIGMASPMIQEVFGGKLIGVTGTLKDLAQDQRVQLATLGAAFAALLSLFNIAGRIFWASLSDYLGRKRTYFVFFALGIVLYAAAPWAGRLGGVAL